MKFFATSNRANGVVCWLMRNPARRCCDIGSAVCSYQDQHLCNSLGLFLVLSPDSPPDSCWLLALTPTVSIRRTRNSLSPRLCLSRRDAFSVGFCGHLVSPGPVLSHLWVLGTKKSSISFPRFVKMEVCQSRRCGGVEL